MGLPNEIVNGSFENGLDNWATSGTTTLFGPGSFCGADPVDGGTMVGAAASWGNFDGSITQIVEEENDPDPTRWKEYDLTFWYQLHDWHQTSSWENTYVQATIGWNNDGGPIPGAPDNTIAGPVYVNPIGACAGSWQLYEMVGTIEDINPKYVSVNIHWWAVDGTEWSIAYVDAVDFEGECVPEPATMAMLGLGGLGLLLRRRR
jgi:hypothetical protein